MLSDSQAQHNKFPLDPPEEPLRGQQDLPPNPVQINHIHHSSKFVVEIDEEADEDEDGSGLHHQQINNRQHNCEL